MALRDAIKFKYLIDQLTKQELNGFLVQLLNQSKDTIITALFEHFANNTSKAQHFNDKISTIIRKRKPKSKLMEVPIAKNKLDTIPTTLIGQNILNFPR